ncbi:MAG: hypothetical protein PQJ60_02715 [Spirochaetales bacterium]|nr:hypothetical protein [Spirochaetales bacterium]
MKKILIPLILCLSALIWAEIGDIDGVGLNMDFSGTIERDTDENGDTSSASEYDLFLQPSAHFFLDESTEFVPYLTLGNHWEYDADGLNDDIDNEIYRFYVGGGASLLWHFLDTWKISMVTGFRGDLLFGLKEFGANAPSGDSGDPEKFSMDLQFYVPLAMDFLLSEKMTLRLSADMMKVGFSYEQEKDEDGTEASGLFESSFPFLDDDDMALVSLAILYWFGD